jgi:DNA-binding transcriptional LysR family regulator
MLLKFRELEVFRVIMETGSITMSASVLRVTQPAISKMLQQTEERLGFKCFIRDHGRLTPTPEARALLPEVMKAISAIESVQHFADDLKTARSGVVSIAAVPSISTSILPNAIRRFRAERPNVIVRLNSMNNHEVVRLVAEHRVDMGLVMLPADDQDTFTRDICATDLVCVVPKGHALAGVEKVGPRELSEFPLISFGRDQPLSMLVGEAFASLKMRPLVDIEVSQSAMALALIRAGAGIAVMDGFALMAQADDDLVVKVFHPNLRLKCRLLWSRHHPVTRLASSFVDDLEAEISQFIEAGRLYPASGGPGMPAQDGLRA